MSGPFRSPGGVIIPPPRHPRFVDVDFAAPLGRRVRLVTLLSVVIPAGIVLFALGLALTRPSPPVPLAILLLAPLIIVGMVVAVGWFSHVCGYRLTRDELVVLGRRRARRFALAGLMNAEAEPAALAWSVKVFGNDGVGAITGRFWNRRLGLYRAFVSDRRCAVVLRWPGQCLVVSPDRTEEFVREVRARAGLQN
jgi:hypothetical protein